MSYNRNEAVKLAREGTNFGGALHSKLCSEMCWDAVATVINRAGGPDYHGNKGAMIGLRDQLVASGQAMAQVPAGAIIGFFRGNNLAHVMIALGGGEAAGTKNGCIGDGFTPMGWHKEDLATNFNSIRGMTVTYRP